MASKMEMLRAKVAQLDTRTSGNSGGGRDNAIYPHWDIPEGASARVRFLPDGDSNNDFFWVERAMIRLPFSGIKGQTSSKPVIVQVPCMEMYGKDEPCPILSEVRTWFKDKSLEEMGRKYWKKRSFIYQGFVRENPLNEASTPDNPIRRFTISPSIQPLIMSAIMDPEIEEIPIDYERGLDFLITKTNKGQYADYSTSKWARKESALTQVERAAIDTFGLFNLKDFLPKKPGETELKIIKEMFEASVDGATYDESRWGQYYKPYGSSNSDDEDNHRAPARVAAPVARQVAVQESAPWDEEHSVASTPVNTAPKGDSNQRAADILAMIRNRKTAE